MEQRLAVCGACGCEAPVTAYMKRERAHQFQARPNEQTDLYYCGCQHEPEDGWPPDPRFL